MNDHPNLQLEVRSYTDCRESDDYNLKLSNKRAKTSAWYIKARISNPERVTSKGYGESNLLNDCSCKGQEVSNCTERQHQQNRRSEILIATNKK